MDARGEPLGLQEAAQTFHQPRLRRESYGELVQIDGSEHRWFENRGEPCTLLVFIDDATSRLMQLRFVLSESTISYFQAMHGYLKDHGCPVAFYFDKHSVFRASRQEAKGGQGMTQFGRALAELHIEILCAYSSQAQGASSEPTAPCRIAWSRSCGSRHLRHGCRKRVPAKVHGALQPEVLAPSGQGGEPAPQVERAGIAAG